jgi:hypothetical protein
MLDKQDKPDPLPDGPLPDGPVPDEQLVAYLDGELDAELARRIELQLAAAPELRRRLDSLSGVWTMLDELDRPQTDNEFTETTLEMVAIAAQDDGDGSDGDDGGGGSSRWRLRRVLMFSGVVSAAFLLGFVCVAIARPDGDRRLLDNMAVVERLDELRQIDDIEGYPATFHVRDFLDCVKTRSRPLANAEAACYSHIACHAANIAAFLGRKLAYDHRKNEFVGDEQANRLRSEALREPWRL